MERRWTYSITLGSLLTFVAAAALVLSILRRQPPPNEWEAIPLAKAHFAVHKEFDYPAGYRSHADWDQQRSVWRVEFKPTPDETGYYLCAEVSRDRTCRTVPIDWTTLRP